MRPEKPPEWFSHAVSDGLAKLYLLRLDGAPVANSTKQVAWLFIEAIWGARGRWLWRGAREVGAVERINKAFAQARQELDRWPSPARIIQLIPEGAPQRLALLRPSISPAEKEENKARFRHLKRQIAGMVKA